MFNCTIYGEVIMASGDDKGIRVVEEVEEVIMITAIVRLLPRRRRQKERDYFKLKNT